MKKVICTVLYSITALFGILMLLAVVMNENNAAAIFVIIGVVVFFLGRFLSRSNTP